MNLGTIIGLRRFLARVPVLRCAVGWYNNTLGAYHYATYWRDEVDKIGQPAPQTWAELSRDCQSVFGGGYTTHAERQIFHHGIRTVFNLLEAEMLPLAQCRAVQRIREAE